MQVSLVRTEFPRETRHRPAVAPCRQPKEVASSHLRSAAVAIHIPHNNAPAAGQAWRGRTQAGRTPSGVIHQIRDAHAIPGRRAEPPTSRDHTQSTVLQAVLAYCRQASSVAYLRLLPHRHTGPNAALAIVKICCWRWRRGLFKPDSRDTLRDTAIHAIRSDMCRGRQIQVSCGVAAD